MGPLNNLTDSEGPYGEEKIEITTKIYRFITPEDRIFDQISWVSIYLFHTKRRQKKKKSHLLQTQTESSKFSKVKTSIHF